MIGLAALLWWFCAFVSLWFDHIALGFVAMIIAIVLTFVAVDRPRDKPNL